MNIDHLVVRLIKYLIRRFIVGFFDDESGKWVGAQDSVIGSGTSASIISTSTNGMLVEGYRRVTSGNQAFDEYRKETLKRLEEDREAFEQFMVQLRRSKDKAEFDQFMAERANATKKAEGEG